MADFWPKDVWPPSSPDLSLLDYYWWGVVAERSNGNSHPNVEALKTAISEAWGQIPRDIRAAAAFRSRLEKCMDAGGGRFE